MAPTLVENSKFFCVLAIIMILSVTKERQNKEGYIILYVKMHILFK